MGTAFAAISAFITPIGEAKVPIGTSLETSSAFIETKAMHIGRADFTYFLDKIVSFISNQETQSSLDLEVYASEAESGPFVLVDKISLARNDPAYVDPPGSRFYKFIWRDVTIVERWRLHGFEIYGEPGGEEF